MIAKQCIFMDEEKTVHPGIYCTDNIGDNYIICLCCGGIIDPREVVFKDFESWMSLDELDEIAEEKNDELKDLREAESHIRTHIWKTTVTLKSVLTRGVKTSAIFRDLKSIL